MVFITSIETQREDTSVSKRLGHTHVVPATQEAETELLENFKNSLGTTGIKTKPNLSNKTARLVYELALRQDDLKFTASLGYRIRLCHSIVRPNQLHFLKFQGLNSNSRRKTTKSIEQTFHNNPPPSHPPHPHGNSQ